MSVIQTDRDTLLAQYRWSPQDDLCHDAWAPSPEPRPWPKDISKPKVELPAHYQAEAEAYMAVIARQWPFQMRSYLTDPMWWRFCETWATGPASWSLAERQKRAMRSI